VSVVEGKRPGHLRGDEGIFDPIKAGPQCSHTERRKKTAVLDEKKESEFLAAVGRQRRDVQLSEDRFERLPKLDPNPAGDFLSRGAHDPRIYI